MFILACPFLQASDIGVKTLHSILACARNNSILLPRKRLLGHAVDVRTLCVCCSIQLWLPGGYCSPGDVSECLTATFQQPLSNCWLSSWSNGGCSVSLSCMLFICILFSSSIFSISVLCFPTPLRTIACYLLFFLQRLQGLPF
ncbi:hypothetical protein GDO78_011050 [Eleutherodactylus coqui]|uniref:Uncharacterized protein n=1 Tax=Eleutherodactylus coqui TaxID=57060 RepID=A0A8J6K6Z6_ELECQ|nr:hypothetical protein GDO78_011050 [Eleutherodactylus coqui]